MIYKKVRLDNKDANVYVLPLGPVNLICITTDIGMIACGAFDIQILDKYIYPAARIQSLKGIPLATI